MPTFATRREVFGADDQTWLGSAHGTDTADSATITLDAPAIAGYTNGVIPSGTLLTKSGNVYTADNTSATPDGFLLDPLRLTYNGGYPIGPGNVVGNIVRHGQVVDARRVAKGLPALTNAQKTALAGRFVID